MPKKTKKSVTKKVVKNTKVASKAVSAAPTNIPETGIASKIRPLADRIVIKEDNESVEKQTSSGIIIPVGVNEDKAGRRGTVVATGPGRTEDGKLIKPAVSVGDKVVFQWGDKVKIGDEEYFIVREQEILAVIK